MSVEYDRQALARLMDRRGMTEMELAKRTGRSRTAIRLLRAGHGIPRVDTLLRLADALQVSIRAFLRRAA